MNLDTKVLHARTISIELDLDLMVAAAEMMTENPIDLVLLTAKPIPTLLAQKTLKVTKGMIIMKKIDTEAAAEEMKSMKIASILEFLLLPTTEVGANLRLLEIIQLITTVEVVGTAAITVTTIKTEMIAILILGAMTMIDTHQAIEEIITTIMEEKSRASREIKGEGTITLLGGAMMNMTILDMVRRKRGKNLSTAQFTTVGKSKKIQRTQLFLTASSHQIWTLG